MEKIEELRRQLAEAGVSRLKYGDKNKYVRSLQNVLNVPADGIFGSRTKAALEALGIADGVFFVSDEQPDPAPLHSPVTIIPGVPFYCQADPRWAGRTLGEEQTFQKSGCAVTCCAMIADYLFADPHTPADVDRYLDKRSGYVGDSIRWDLFSSYLVDHSPDHIKKSFEVPPVVGYKYKEVKFGPADGEGWEKYRGDYIFLLNLGFPVLLRVAYVEQDPNKYRHFVLGVGYESDMSPVFHDPASGHGSAYDYKMSTLPYARRQYRVVGMDWFEYKRG